MFTSPQDGHLWYRKMAGIKIVDLPAVGRDLIATDLLELSLAGGTGSRKITGQEIMNASKLSVNNTPIINGTVGRVLFQGTGDVLQQSANLFWDNSNGRLGIGTSTPTNVIDILGSGNSFLNVKSTGTTTETGIIINNDLYYAAFEVFGSLFSNTALRNTSLFATQSGITTMAFATLGAANIAFRTSSNGSNNERLTIFGSTGNIGVNTTTDAGFKLDVNGTARVTSLTTTDLVSPSPGQTIFLKNSGGTQAGRIFCDGSILRIASSNGSSTINIFANGNLGVSQTTDVGFKLDVNGTARVQGATTISAAANDNIRISGSAIEFSRTIDGAYNTSITKAGSTNNIGLTFSALNGGNFNFVRASSATTLFMNGATGNVLIGTTTDAGYRLDVSGTARVNGVLTIGGDVQGKISADFQYLNLYHNGGTLQILSFGFGSSIGASGYLRINQNAGDTAGTTSGTIHRYDFNSSITNSTGTAQWNFQSLRPNYNFTGTYSGTVRGFYYNPTLTSMTGVSHFAIHTTAGRVRFEGLPTSPTGLNAGDIYNDGGTLRIV
jgi:hypothetical protein